VGAIQVVVSEACYPVGSVAQRTVVAEAAGPIAAAAAAAGEAGPIAGSQEAAGTGSVADTAEDTGCQNTGQGLVARSLVAAVGSPGEVVGSLEGIVDILAGAAGPGSLAAAGDYQTAGL